MLGDHPNGLSAFRELCEADRTAASALPATIERVPRARVLPVNQNARVVRILLTGWAFRSTMLRSGTRQITAFLLPGEICTPNGFSAVSERQELCAATDLEFACVPMDAFEAFAETPAVDRAMRSIDCRNAAILQEWVVNLTRRPAIPRTAHLILELQTRLSFEASLPSPEFDLPLTQSILGDALGLSSVHLNRTFRRMREEDLLSFRSGRMAIHDRPRLVRIAEFDPRYLTEYAAPAREQPCAGTIP